MCLIAPFGMDSLMKSSRFRWAYDIFTPENCPPKYMPKRTLFEIFQKDSNIWTNCCPFCCYLQLLKVKARQLVSLSSFLQLKTHENHSIHSSFWLIGKIFLSFEEKKSRNLNIKTTTNSFDFHILRCDIKKIANKTA